MRPVGPISHRRDLRRVHTRSGVPDSHNWRAVMMTGRGLAKNLANDLDQSRHAGYLLARRAFRSDTAEYGGGGFGIRRRYGFGKRYSLPGLDVYSSRMRIRINGFLPLFQSLAKSFYRG
ncbi:hypothetical protein Trydic_g12682 [Trypoxylus dichotomus]